MALALRVTSTTLEATSLTSVSAGSHWRTTHVSSPAMLTFGQLPWTKRRRPAFILLTILGAILLTSAFPYQYSGASLSMIWLVDAEAFFLTGVFLNEVVFRRLGLLAGFLTAGQIMFYSTSQVFQQRMAAGSDISLPHVAIVFLVAAMVLYLNAHFMTRWSKELTSALYDSIGLRLASYTATTLAVFGMWAICSEHWVAVMWAALALTLAFSGRILADRDLPAQAHIVATLAIGRTMLSNILPTDPHAHLTWRLISVVLVAVLLYAASRWAVALSISGLVMLWEAKSRDARSKSSRAFSAAARAAATCPVA